MATYSELLAAVELAILDVVQNGQDVWHMGDRYTKADLGKLEALRNYYQSQARNETSCILDRTLTGIPHREYGFRRGRGL